MPLTATVKVRLTDMPEMRELAVVARELIDTVTGCPRCLSEYARRMELNVKAGIVGRHDIDAEPE